MSFEQSITGLIGRLKSGDARAAQKIWEAYFDQLVRLARKRLSGTERRAADEEDVVLSALESFYSGVAHGRFPRLEDRHDLWRLLVVITARKAHDQREHERRSKRGGGRAEPRDHAALEAAADELSPDVEELLRAPPTPELVAVMAEECTRLLAALDDPGLREIALWKMEGHTTEEIAAKLGRVPRTVERKLELIRLKWTRQ